MSTQERAGWRAVLAALPWAVRSQLRRQDLALHGAAVTFYAAIAGVPMLLLAVRLATLVVGEERIRYLATTLEAALPRSSGAGPVARTIIEQAAGTSWWVTCFAVFAASLYGEGLRRAYASLARVAEDRTFADLNEDTWTLPEDALVGGGGELEDRQRGDRGRPRARPARAVAGRIRPAASRR